MSAKHEKFTDEPVVKLTKNADTRPGVVQEKGSAARSMNLARRVPQNIPKTHTIPHSQMLAWHRKCEMQHGVLWECLKCQAFTQHPPSLRSPRRQGREDREVHGSPPKREREREREKKREREEENW